MWCFEHKAQMIMDVHVLSTSVPSDASLTADQKLYWLHALLVVGDWSVHDDGDGRLFYYDRRTDSSQWEVPEGLVSRETEFMTKLMLQNAVARSGVWTAHDAGNGTLYYFNEKTRVSAWERPSEWGKEEAVAAAAVEAREKEVAETEREKEKEKKQEKEKAIKKEMKKQRKHKKDREKQAELKKEQAEKEATEKKPVQEEEKEPLTAEEVLVEQEHNARKQKWTEQFLAMLRDKNIMPFCKWSVALPQIAGDPRFMGVPTMDERRAIFEHFIEHRREDLKVEKKSKLKHAKQVFTQLLREQFQLDSWESKTTLSVFLSTLEDNLEPERYKQVQDDALAFLTLSTQEKIYSKAVAEYKLEALKRDGEQLRLTKFLEDKLGMEEDTLILQWEGDEVQKLIREFYSSVFLSGMLLSEQKQRQVFEELMARKACDQALKREVVNDKQLERLPLRRPTQDHSTDKVRDSGPRRERHTLNSDRYRSRSRSRRRRYRSGSRSPSYEREKRYRSRKSSHRRSSSSSRSRSRGRSSRRSFRHSRHYSSSPSRSRSRSRSRTR